MRYYPIFLDLRGQRCVVVGGGRVAERKVKGLLRAGAEVQLVSPTLTPRLALLAAKRESALPRDPTRKETSTGLAWFSPLPTTRKRSRRCGKMQKPPAPW